MIPEKTITICGKEVLMRYCAASETGYELLSDGKSSSIFVPDIEYADDGETVVAVKQNAKTDDYIKLALASIIAAYERNKQEVPITAEEIMYDATPTEITAMITTVMELRTQWYTIPKTIPDNEFDDTAEKQKNAQPPANDSNAS